jgi:hypothetical protein
MSSTINFAKLTPAERAVIAQQLAAVEKDHASALKRTYSEHLQGLVVSVIENQTMQASDKSDWAGYGVRSVPVIVEGHEFSVSVTITDTQAKGDREKARKLAEARALLAEADAAE